MIVPFNALLQANLIYSCNLKSQTTRQTAPPYPCNFYNRCVAVRRYKNERLIVDKSYVRQTKKLPTPFKAINELKGIEMF